MLILVFGSLSIAPYFSNAWTLWQGISEELTYLFAGIAFLLSAQFSRSRLSWLTLFFLSLSFFSLEFETFRTLISLFGIEAQAQDYVLQLDKPESMSKVLFLVGVGWLCLLACAKDRGILSIHSVYRLLSFIAIVAFVQVWCALIAWAAIEYKQNGWSSYLPQLEVYFPVFVCSTIILWQAIKSESLVLSAILTTLILWLLSYFEMHTAPWSVTSNVLFVTFILVVLVDSYFLAYRDELTALPSRRALMQLSLSLGSKYTVAMMDIDHFKKFNDKYGHDIGDQVLKLVASKLTKVKGGGKVFRYGGEEFTVVFPRKDAQQSAIELERLRQSIADYKMIIRQAVRKTKESRGKKAQTEEKSVSVTISIGVATRMSGQKFEQALKTADEALYRAKKAGRNNVSY